jgi:hypothetical protein
VRQLAAAFPAWRDQLAGRGLFRVPTMIETVREQARGKAKRQQTAALQTEHLMHPFLLTSWVCLPHHWPMAGTSYAPRPIR